MKLAALDGDLCAICRVSSHEHARCGTCEGNIQLLQLCRFCDLWNEREKVAWNRQPFDNGDVAGVDDDELAEARSSRRRPRAHRVERAATRGRGRPRSDDIDDEVMPLLLERRVRVVVERIDLEGRNRGTYERWHWLSRRQIARHARCSQHAVDRRYRDLARASSARRITKDMK